MQAQSPYTVLLNSQNSKSAVQKRSEEETLLLEELLKNNKLFTEFGISQETIKQICNRIVLIWVQNPHINEISNNEIYLVLEGKSFQYVQNKSMSLKAKLHENSDYIMVRKLVMNDFFLVYSPPGRYTNRTQYKKYQLMVDEKTLLGKISDELFFKYFQPIVEERWKKVMDFLKKVEILQSLPQILFYELSKYIIQEGYQAGSEIIKKQEKSQYVYFVKSGEIQFRTYQKSDNRQTPNPNYQVAFSKAHKRYFLGQYDVFGMDAFNAETYEEQNSSSSAEAKSNCLVYKIDKKILAIVISSFEEDLRPKNKNWSSINLNEQIQGQGYQTPDKLILNENVQKIKTSEKKIRDIKLRFLTTSKNKRFKKQQQEEKEEDEDDLLISDLKYKSCQSFNHLKDMELKEKFRNSFKSKFNTYGGPFLDDNPKISQINMSPYDEHFRTQFTSMKSSMMGSKVLVPKGINSIKRKSLILNSNNGREQTDIIKGFIDQRQKNIVKKKSQQVKQRNTEIKKRSQTSMKRTFSLKMMKGKSPSKLHYELGEQLFERMNKLSENPLLFKIETARKKMEREEKRVIERNKQLKKKNAPKPGSELIFIKNN